MNFNEAIKNSGLKKKFIAEKIQIRPVELSYYLNNTRPMPEDVKKRLKEFLS